MDERASRRVTTLASHLACGDRANVHRNPTAGFATRFGDLFKRDAIDAPKGSVVLAPDVADALRRGSPVVALESTIISHGMPYPDNLTMAREVEAIVREHGATPATIAIIDGVPRVGLTDDQLVQLASLGPSALKVSRRDVAHCIAKGATGATTVSATMLLAHAAGISIFVTGGVGGVHREGQNTLDVSADLTELGRTPVCVVCAGAKSVLDIPRTLEYLETQGVCVAGFGADEFPAFFTRKSGVNAPCRVDTPREAAAVVKAGRVMGLGGTVLAVPIPAEHEADGATSERAIERALAEANEGGISGNACTPFLLKRIRELTGGKSLVSNVALVKNNARVGALVAVELAGLDSRNEER
jgi:pseudouridine-5'-phosphate glycosidase